MTEGRNGHQAEFKGLIFVRYLDHVAFNRSLALTMKPQVREAVGWLIYECSDYLTLAWDRDADPPTLKGGDPKASGLVLLKSGILELKRLVCSTSKETSEDSLNCQEALAKGECALQPKERKTQKTKGKTAT